MLTKSDRGNLRGAKGKRRVKKQSPSAKRENGDTFPPFLKLPLIPHETQTRNDEKVIPPVLQTGDGKPPWLHYVCQSLVRVRQLF